jgi:hypothetical protein
VLGDGTPGSAELVPLYGPRTGRSATDLDFHDGDLWVVVREHQDGSPCNEPARGAPSAEACARLGGTVVILDDAVSEAPTSRAIRDPNAWHFMRLPTGIAFGANGLFATSGEARTANWDDEPSDFMGPTLWSSDADIFGIEPEGKNGSHLDMLHASPFGMGIAFERANVYWVWNGQAGALDRYDFGAPHEVGGEDHSDGTSSRWVNGELVRVPGVPSHLQYSAKKRLLYAADPGNGRVVALDTSSGSLDGSFPTDDFQMPDIARRVRATLTDFVPPGVLDTPSGIALAGDLVYVTDNWTGWIVAFDASGTEVGALETGLPPGALGGITIGPDGKAYVTTLDSAAVYRVERR